VWVDGSTSVVDVPVPAIRYLTPAEMLQRLPFKNPDMTWRRNRLARIRKRCKWLGIDPQQKRNVREDHFMIVVAMLKSRTLSKSDDARAAVILGLPRSDPTKEELATLKEQIKQEGLARKAGRRG
jgi:hypothetical protein